MKLLCFFLLIGACLSSSAQTNVAVLDFDGKGIADFEAATLTDKFRSEMVRQSMYSVIERGRMEEILKEQGFQQTGCTSSECAVEIGQLLGVTNMFAGSVGKVGQTFFVTIRKIDVSTGKIIASADWQAQGAIDNVLSEGIPSLAAQLSTGRMPTVVIEEHPHSRKAQVVESQQLIVPGQMTFSGKWFPAIYIDGKRLKNKEVKPIIEACPAAEEHWGKYRAATVIKNILTFYYTFPIALIIQARRNKRLSRMVEAYNASCASGR